MIFRNCLCSESVLNLLIDLEKNELYYCICILSWIKCDYDFLLIYIKIYSTTTTILLVYHFGFGKRNIPVVNLVMDVHCNW